MPRVMILSHGHPELSHGGAERASYAIHGQIRKGAMPGWDSVYVARADRRHIGHDGDFGAFRGRADEIVACPPEVDHFFHASSNVRRLYAQLDELVNKFQPDLVHIHHFIYWGIEIFEYFENRDIPTVATLHEYMAICHRDGQMIKPSGSLCYQSSPSECAQCFPDITSGLFFLRDSLFIQQLARATRIVSPSAFLADRIKIWSKGRFEAGVVENPRDQTCYEPISPLPAGKEKTFRSSRIRVGYFGQINQFKGTEVMLDAIAIVKKQGIDLRVSLFGTNLNVQEEAFRVRIQEKIAELGQIVDFFGSYRNEEVLRLMSECDFVIVPSLWWENSPMVIQEAIDAGVRIVASRLGAIEEKLRGYSGAIFFQAGSPSDLADKIITSLQKSTARTRVIPPPPLASRAEVAWAKLSDIYIQVLAPKSLTQKFIVPVRAV